MSLTKQSKVLTKTQIETMYHYLVNGRNGLRNSVIFLLSVKSGLRAKEISRLSWKEVCNSDGEVDTVIRLTDSSSKGKSGRVIPIHKDLHTKLCDLLVEHRKFRSFNLDSSFVIRTERTPFTTSQVIVNMFQKWYRNLGFLGCSSHSGRRTFITNCSKKISTVGGSLRDVQYLSGHSSLQTTQRYIEGDSESQRKVVNII